MVWLAVTNRSWITTPDKERRLLHRKAETYQASAAEEIPGCSEAATAASEYD